jgi:hypothetical protein
MKLGYIWFIHLETRNFVKHVYDQISSKLGVDCDRLLYGLHTVCYVGHNRNNPAGRGALLDRKRGCASYSRHPWIAFLCSKIT